jgi:hypothetical protein
MTKKRYIGLKREQIMLERKSARVADFLEIVNRNLSQYDQTCFSCPNTGDTTDLVLCEIANTEYPRRCAEMRGK